MILLCLARLNYFVLRLKRSANSSKEDKRDEFSEF